MTFTGLETILISLCVCIVSTVVAVAGMSARFVSKAACERTHRNECAINEELKELIKGLRDEFKELVTELKLEAKRDRRILFNMMRAIISRLDLSPEERAEMLNMQGEK